VEIADRTINCDRIRKANLYASARIAAYLVLNLNDNQLEVYRHPQRDESQVCGVAYREVKVLRATDAIASLAAPHAMIVVADLLP
jgi:Uma2 family endonuclease